MTDKSERRRAVRDRPTGEVKGVDLGSGGTVRLLDFSERSFAVESSEPLGGAKVREFEFPLGLGKIAFKGIPKRRERIESVDGETRYLVAFEFTWKTPTGRELVEHFVRALRGEVA